MILNLSSGNYHRNIRSSCFNSSTVLSLNPEQIDHIQSHARDCYPQECCGLMLGHIVDVGGELQKTLLGLYTTDNAWDSASESIDAQASEQTLTANRRYWIAPQDLFNAQKYARTQGWDIIGVYHSHPNHEAVPSECDRNWAWPQYSYVIVAVNNGVPHDFRSWMLDAQQQFRSEPVTVSASAVTSPLETDI